MYIYIYIYIYTHIYIYNHDYHYLLALAAGDRVSLATSAATKHARVLFLRGRADSMERMLPIAALGLEAALSVLRLGNGAPGQI